MELVVQPGRRVDAYKNLNTDNGVSVRCRETGTETYGRVIEVVERVCIEDATFIVGEKGRERVRESGTKNVHACVRGEWTDATVDSDEAVAITYNPKRFDSFVTRNDYRPVATAERAEVTYDGVRALGVEYDD